MNDAYFEMMKQTMKAAGMSDEQIEATIKAQKAAMGAMPDMMQAAAQAAAQAGAQMQQQLGNLMEGMDMSSCFEFTKPSSLSQSDQWAVACGADLIHLRADVINDLTTGSDAETVRETLADDWGIGNKKEFIQMADSLLNGRHSKIYEQLGSGKPVEGFEEEAENYQQAKTQFAADGLLEKGQVPALIIWDLGRLINISRFAFDAEYLTREEALEYIRAAALLVKKNYHSWKELSVAYQFGRAVWGGLDDSYESMQQGMNELLSEEDSPWVTLPFDLKLDFAQ